MACRGVYGERGWRAMLCSPSWLSSGYLPHQAGHLVFWGFGPCKGFPKSEPKEVACFHLGPEDTGMTLTSPSCSCLLSFCVPGGGDGHVPISQTRKLRCIVTSYRWQLPGWVGAVESLGKGGLRVLGFSAVIFNSGSQHPFLQQWPQDRAGML